MKQISIVVPVYNAQKYLTECIESILNQTYQYIELILVDDGSTDDSKMICDQYQKRCSSIVVIHQDNKGQNAARKAGAKIANSEYVMFVDADDWLDLNICEKFMDAIQGDTDIVLSYTCKVYEDGNHSVIQGLKAGIYTGECIIQKSIDLNHFFSISTYMSLCNVLFRKNIIIDQLELSDLRINYGEDLACMLGALLQSRKVRIIDYIGYYYRKIPASFMHAHLQSNVSVQKLLYQYLYKLYRKNKLPAGILTIFQYCIINFLLLGGYEIFQTYPGIFPYENAAVTDRLIIYGAGVFGEELYLNLQQRKVPIIAWVDRQWRQYQSLKKPVEDTMLIKECDYDYILVAATNYEMSRSIYNDLLSMGVKKEKICCISKKIIDSTYTNNILEGLLQ